MSQQLDNPGLSPEEEQEKMKNDAITQVKGNAFHMKRALDKCNLHEALKFSAAMLGEFRTSLLSPQKYYELYIKVFDELTHLESYFLEEVKRGTKVEELYEVVQHAGNIVPRMYLLITVGSVYIQSKEAFAKDILKDLVEMCKGVQHPTRGLFLRNYLSHVAKNKLPDTGNEYEGEGGTVLDSLDFILQNFHEMVRLWVRMETKMNVRDKDKREKERKELCILVGINLVRLSQLEGVDLQLYEKSVLNRILEIIIQCKDQIAQQYLMEVIIQVFPDEFHLATLQSFLESCMLLHSGVDLRNIFTALMDRLAKFAASFLEGSKAKDSGVETAIEGMSGLFSKYISKAQLERPKVMTQPVFMQTQCSLLNLVLNAYPGDLPRINEVIGAAFESIDKSSDKKMDAPTTKLFKKFLISPIEHFQNAVTCLEIDKIPDVLAELPFKARREYAMDVALAINKFGHRIESVEAVEKLFVLISPLVKDEDGSSEEELDEEDFVEEQSLVARLIHLFYNASPDMLYKIYSVARKEFGSGGSKRMPHTLVPMVFAYLQLATKIQILTDKGDVAKTTPQKVLQNVLKILSVLREPIPEMVLKLSLQTGSTADFCKLEDQTYDAIAQAMVLYEEEITDSKQQIQILTVIIATLQNLRNISVAGYDTLGTKACQYSSKLLKKPDQCQAAFLCSHLFWGCEYRDDASKVLECLQRSLKIVDGCIVSQQTHLFVLILNQYLHYFAANNNKVTVKYLNVLMELINTNMSKGEEESKPEGPNAPVQVFYKRTVQHIKMRQLEGVDTDRWSGINVAF